MFKYEQDTNYLLMQSVEQSLKAKMGDISIKPSDAFKSRMAAASEIDIVLSGLDYTMEKTGHKIMRNAKMHNLGLDLRTAAYVTATLQIVNTASEAGLSF